ncbi:molybdopterin molybdenumtransferase MoeA [Solemya pervernicosa gill symbiont]|uniref:Molybdopterin molybdenumtransferase n=2 Tax=Gammaproteobacteria incertae sedis TaxID=118884 RepID=A0A1T2L6C8_9GAMM|nr:gephyrin-like molybdotransferase Glp [Candidatus Reidiella endopervernicosa]OOZ40641.1 molybdopterin molybdenumtransferase MoeA [Solemya pervernicosa gill symbiont]QKQ27395.1 molybdopterin molybdotransferase MoeA [Candidatus Reidiella endopervernicosa]
MSDKLNIDCCSQPSGLLSVEAARQRILEPINPVTENETLELRHALGRTLAEAVTSSLDVPSYKNSAMDGYALHSRDLPNSGSANLQLIGTSLAGHPYDGSIEPGSAIRIMTGAAVPDDYDTVIMQEQVERSDEIITISSDHCAGENVRYPGEDIKSGDIAGDIGLTIRPAELGLLASLGISDVSVKRRPKVVFFSTGDELREAGDKLEAGQIYDSNRYTLYGMLNKLDVEMEDLGIIPDQPEAIERAFREAGERADIVITSGGVSVGDADYVKQTLEQFGSIDFWKIAMKPGKPLAFGALGKSVFFGLPGNPVSTMATFYQFVIPAIRKLKGETAEKIWTLKVPCHSKLNKRPGRTDFQRGVLQSSADGSLSVHTTGLQGSHVLSSMSKANCFIVLPAESGNIEAGSMVEVQPFESML